MEEIAEKFPEQPEGENPFFMLGKWGEFTQWRCRFCPWDTLDGEAAMLEHYESVHKPPIPAKPPISAATSILIADRFGNPVRNEE